jgi:putative DNA primase/helicase
MQACRKVGVFYETKIRGRGVWLDEGKVVEHFGERLRVNGEEMHLQDLDTQCIYEIRPHRKIIKADPVQREKVTHATKLIESLAWENPLHGKLFLGGLALGMIGGTLKWRPHLMITGEAGSGKTTLLNYVAGPILEASGLNRSANTTEAGVRQQVRCDSLPYMIDEFDTNNGNPKILQGILNLMRAASSGEDMRRGTPSGKALTFSARFSFVTFGINPPILNEADQSRITSMHLSKRNHKGHWPDLERELVNTFTEEFGEGMYMKMVEALPTFEKTLSEFHKIIATKFSQRKAQQYGTLLAGYYALCGGGSIEAIVEEWIKGETQENLSEDSGPKEALKHLLDLRIEGDGLQGLHTLSGLLEGSGNDKAFANYGIKYTEKDNSLYVSVKNARLQAWFDKTNWVKYSVPLSRIEGSKVVNVRMNGMQTKCVHIPLKVVEFERSKDDV